ESSRRHGTERDSVVAVGPRIAFQACRRRIAAGPAPSIALARQALAALAGRVARESRRARGQYRPFPRTATPRFSSIRAMAPTLREALETRSLKPSQLESPCSL